MTNRSDNGIDIIRLISHDLNGPLGSIKGFIELIGIYGELNERQARYHERAMMGVERLEHMIVRVLELMKLESLKTIEFEACDVSELINKCIADTDGLAEVKNIRIITNFASDLRPVWGHAILLQHMLLNLLSNAVKYNQDEGHVWISVSMVGEQVRIDVQDDGQGISSENLPLIFGQFYREGSSEAAHNPIQGMGIGLSIVKLVIDRHHGEVDVKSIKGEGTLFSVFLPAAVVALPGDQVRVADLAEADPPVFAVVPDEFRETLDDLDDSMQELSDTSYDEDSGSQHL